MGYSYSPLPPGGFIRLLQARDAEDGSNLLCDFKVVCVNDCDDEYVALSYAWEASPPVGRLNFHDGSFLELSQTLATLFAAMKERTKTFTLWIDALCIDQENLPERESQVRMMDRVYSNASGVLLWLGPSDAESGAAFRFMNSMRHRSWPDDWEKESKETLSEVKTVFHLLERPWFLRTWVIQEVVLNDQVDMMCGDDAVDFSIFKSSVYAIWKYFETLGSYEDDHPAVRGLWNVTRLLSIQGEYRVHGEIQFERLLEAAYFCEASDERDKVFGFLGIGDRSRPVPMPDYTASVEDVYLRTAQALLCHGTCLDSLALSGIARRALPSSLPTWVPDLRNRGLEEPFATCDRASWDAGGIMKASPAMEGPEHLRIHVRPIDVVDATCPPFNSRSVSGQQAAMRAIFELKSRLRRPVSEEKWNGIASSSMIMDLDIDDVPAGPEYRGYFYEWLAWLWSSTSEDDLKKIQGNKFQQTIGPRIDDWKAFLTRRGDFCVGPPAAEVGDVVCTVPGCRLPLILRPWNAEDGVGGDGARMNKNGSLETIRHMFSKLLSKPLKEYILVSWCFSRRLMYGRNSAQRKSTLEVLLR